IETARAALDRNQGALDARRWLAAALYDLGATAHAVQELEAIAAAAPGDFQPHRLLGLIAKDNEQFNEAVAHYRESLRRNPVQPDRPAVLVELGESLVKLNLYEEALQTLGECDRTAAVLTLEAACKQSLARTDEALDELHAAVAMDPAYFPARLQI